MSKLEHQNDAAATMDENIEPVRLHLKWFNASKGFGFLVPEDGSYDAFVHVTVLQEAGLNSASEGAIFDCTICDRGKGKQVTSIIKIISKGVNPVSLSPSKQMVDCDASTITGIVKWYKPEKGFGFVIADDGQKDIFVHKTLIDRHEITHLEDGQRVKMTVKPAEKGREATSLELL